MGVEDNPFHLDDESIDERVALPNPFHQEHDEEDPVDGSAGDSFDLDDYGYQDPYQETGPSMVHESVLRPPSNVYDNSQSSYSSNSSFIEPEKAQEPYTTTMFYQPPVPELPYQQGYPVFQPFQRDNDEPMINNAFSANNTEDAIELLNVAATGDTKVQLLDDGHYSFDYPVPKHLISRIPFEDAKNLTEFTHLRYHAITSDPKDFTDGDMEKRQDIVNYPLRPNLYGVRRETELMIVCTMYNEDEVLLGRTLKGVFKNIKNMYNLPEKENNIHPFGKDAWKKIVVVIVSDGRSKIHERSKALLTLLGCYQEGVIQEKVNDDNVNAHLFEYTTTFGIGQFDYHRGNDGKGFTVPLVTEQTVPVQMMFLLKEQNKQKINSHRWAFNFLCPNLRPKIVCLLDVGTEPGPDSIYKLWQSFKDPQVGGSCGEIRAMLGKKMSPNDEGTFMEKFGRWIVKMFSDLMCVMFNPLIAAQNFEYKISNILDKPMESAFGFVTVLPGAFSAYRYEALQGDPLKAYFHGEDMKTNTEKPAGTLESNMYLAEDRILCFELVAKKGASYVLRYVHDAFGVTDVPSNISEFINQRRRWLNGSFFAALYSVLHFYRIFSSRHSFGRKLILLIEVIYQTVNIGLSWFSLSFYFLVFRILTLGVTATSVGFKAGNILAVVFLWIYIAALGLTFIISFGNKPRDAKRLYQLAFLLFSIVMAYMIFCVIMLTISSVHSIQDEIASSTKNKVLAYFENSKFRNLTVALSSTYALYIIGSLLFLDMFHIVGCSLQYIFLSPAYINVLSVFAFCNIHDISWGTKGAVKVDDAGKKQANKSDSSNELILSEALRDPDELYLLAQTDISEPEAVEKENTLKTSERNYSLGRTYTVLAWLVCNFIILVLVLRTGGLDDYNDNKNNKSSSSTSTSKTKRSTDTNSSNTFMTFVLWCVFVLALFRLFGAIVYRLDAVFRKRRYHKHAVF
ncbi:hypothetical protein OGAPHI_000653 [Ogataea philodendri]|uniref:Chitin synthase n=1 Tax=Ogataea philodendri TaxID=1378263 RepID=A0A9P8PFK2_9ASCO|nr:uncharacterized protein OGAPHI_000653 [Ogataea philodendri]KAH3670942.1 hypothetical protein OGAPHI_000653 [Ogataea philodendri]